MQLRSATSIDDENPLDVPLGVSSYKALQVKNYFSGSLMIMGGIGLLLAGSAGAECVCLCMCVCARARAVGWLGRCGVE